MAGAGSQHNKAHKAGRRAGRSAREKHKDSKDAGGRAPIKSGAGVQQRRADRLNSAKQVRESKRAALLASRRAAAPPRVVALFPLSDSLDVTAAWASLLAACGAPEATGSHSPPRPVTVTTSDARRSRLTLLPPPPVPGDALGALDLARAADCVLLLADGEGGLGEDVERVLATLRALGLPGAIGAVVSGAPPADLKARSAAKKRAAALLARVAAPEVRVMAADGPADWAALVRHLADAAPAVPGWRQHRPQLLVEGAELAGEGVGSDGTVTLLLRGYVRNLGLSVRQAVHVPGAGDFALSQIDALPGPGRGRDGMDADPAVLATAGPEERANLDRENVPDPLAGEQTWPTEEELVEAEAERRAAAKLKKRRLPAGTSEYQAAWILDEDEGSETGSEAGAGSDEAMEEGAPAGVPLAEDDVDSLLNGGAEGTEADMDYAEDEEEEEDDLAARRHMVQDDQEYPDEVETPSGVLARERFGKYRGLKSMRTSPWDPRESLPLEYARVFAFDNFVRTQKRALAAASSGQEAAAPAGTYVQLHVVAVPADAAKRVQERVGAWSAGLASPLTLFGLLQHETKLSVGHFALTLVPEAPAPLANKEELLLVTGVRAFRARPVFSSDEHGADKHKMERFLHPGRPSVATVYAPISYPPLPLLAFRLEGGARPVLAATGSARRPDPDRVVLKKIVLTGYPVRTHKSKAVVRHMFHDADDIRWFRPVDLWTRSGRRGRIREPLGTHGAMKTIFDGPITQADAVCMSLYKRVFPKWPLDMAFAAC
ncbi:hypothetical protein ACKKBF_B35530 [Auxenochlorella protothecoides x Auxenochlorella symbiontica]